MGRFSVTSVTFRKNQCGNIRCGKFNTITLKKYSNKKLTWYVNEIHLAVDFDKNYLKSDKENDTLYDNVCILFSFMLVTTVNTTKIKEITLKLGICLLNFVLNMFN